MKQTRELIREYRKKKRITQKELADITGLSIGSIQGYEQGRFEPKHDQLKKIAAALGVSLADLAPDRYPLAFTSGEEFKAAWEEARTRLETTDPVELQQIKEQRENELNRISENEEQLNSSGLRRLADYSDDLVQSGNYKRK